MLKDALYYPYIELRNADLIKSMALIYDHIYRIVPNNIIPDDSQELQALLEEGLVGRMIDPAIYAEKASNKFMDGLEKWDAAALGFDDEEVSRIHTKKIDQVVRELFLKAGFQQNNDWLHIPAELACHRR